MPKQSETVLALILQHNVNNTVYPAKTYTEIANTALGNVILLGFEVHNKELSLL
jgi:hypothetical protein